MLLFWRENKMTKKIVRVHFLGVGGGIPSLIRAPPSIAVSFHGKVLLFDCGEGTQLQLQRAGLSPQRIREIFISHLHVLWTSLKKFTLLSMTKM